MAGNRIRRDSFCSAIALMFCPASLFKLDKDVQLNPAPNALRPEGSGHAAECVMHFLSSGLAIARMSCRKKRSQRKISICKFGSTARAEFTNAWPQKCRCQNPTPASRIFAWSPCFPLRNMKLHGAAPPWWQTTTIKFPMGEVVLTCDVLTYLKTGLQVSEAVAVGSLNSAVKASKATWKHVSNLCSQSAPSVNSSRVLSITWIDKLCNCRRKSSSTNLGMVEIIYIYISICLSIYLSFYLSFYPSVCVVYIKSKQLQLHYCQPMRSNDDPVPEHPEPIFHSDSSGQLDSLSAIAFPVFSSKARSFEAIS